jgi:hypothetical protein
MEVGFKNLKNCYQRKKFAINLILLKKHSDFAKKFAETDNIKVLEFFY